ncbi:MAG: hypothetical protein ACTS8V_04240 [Arsenophonus sp. ER-QC15-MAG3]
MNQLKCDKKISSYEDIKLYNHNPYLFFGYCSRKNFCDERNFQYPVNQDNNKKIK